MWRSKRSIALTASVASVIEGLEGRRLFTTVPIGIGMNETAVTSDTDYAYAVARYREAGITAVRLFFTQDTNASVSASDNVLKRAVDLYRDGFKVLLMVTPEVPSSTHTFHSPTYGETKTTFNSLLTWHKSGDTTTLKQAVDRWEIGNEVNTSSYYEPSSSTATRLQHYVDNFLMPAAEVLHGASEKVVSSGLTYGAINSSGSPMFTMLDAIQDYDAPNNANPFSLIDYIGYHPYGSLTTVENSTADVRLAVDKSTYGIQGKPILATEWGTDNPTGDRTDESQNTLWASNNDTAYKDAIRGGYDTSYYFATVDANAWRQGGAQAHAGESIITHTSGTSTGSPSTKNPFWNTVKLWQNLNDNPPGSATISGYYYGDTDTDGALDNGEVGQSGKKMYIDVNGNNQFDATEPNVLTDGNGKYSFTVDPGTYTIRRDGLGSGYRLTSPSDSEITVTVSDGQTNANNNFGTSATLLFKGSVFNDIDGNGAKGSGEGGVANQTVWIDADGSNTFNTGDPSTTTDSSGNWQIVASISAGTYNVHVTPTSPYVQTAPTTNSGVISVAIANPNPATGITFGVQTQSTTATLTGVYWGDNNGNGIKDAGESGQSGKTIFVDYNDNDIRDSNEPQAVTGTGGVYTITGITPNTISNPTYHVRRVGSAAGFRFTTPATGYYDLTFEPGDTLTGIDFLTTGQASIHGYYFGDDDGDGVWDSSEVGQGGKQMYIDLDNDGILDSNEPTLFTQDDGSFGFDNLAISATASTTYKVRRWNIPSGYHLTTPTGGVFSYTFTANTPQLVQALFGSTPN